MDEGAVREKYRRLTLALIEEGKTITTMESCTSGQVASLITDTEGSSAVLKGAFVTYSNEAKLQMGVPSAVLERYGVYSRETAISMAEACRRAYRADYGVGVTGSFGNVDPSNKDSVPGEVYFAIAREEGTEGYFCSLPSLPSRLAYKLFMAEKIVDELLPLLKG